MREYPSDQAEIELSILTLRGQRVMLSTDLAKLYDVETKVLMQAVKRNISRFPEDFMFRLETEEWEHLRSRSAVSDTTQEPDAERGELPGNLRSQIVTSSWGGHRHVPYAFTEQGVAMLSSVLRSPQAVRVNIEIMRAFVRLRRMSSEHKALARRIDALEASYDMQFRSVFEAIRQLMAPPENQGNPIGFTARISSKRKQTCANPRP
jgi:hypothetical protein